MIRIKIIVAAVLASWSAAAATTASAHTKSWAAVPKMATQCAGHTMSLMKARRSVLVTIQMTKPGPDVGLKVNIWRGGKHRFVGWAHTGCWTALPLMARKVIPNLCIEVRVPLKPEPSNTRRPPACPAGNVRYYMGVRWVTYTFKISY